jgi:hypothetical protein
MAMRIESSAFSEGGKIPRPYTWSGVPEGAKGLALICDDPDASGKAWVHWVAFDLPPRARGLPEAVPARESIAGGGTQGTNDFRKLGYGGPCPPSGTHRYLFKLYALDTDVNLTSAATKADLERAMEGHILAHATVTGKYNRS